MLKKADNKTININFSSQKGITLAVLVAYIVLAMIVIATLATITAYFRSNMQKFNTTTVYSAEFDKFNLYFLQEINTENNSILLPIAGVTARSIFFSSGNNFTFKDGTVYYNEVKIAEKVTDCTFTVSKENLRDVITVNMEIADETREVKYVMRYNAKAFGEINVEDYTYEVVYEELFSAIYTQTETYTDANGDTATIPAGFAVGISNGINTISDGLVITDQIDSNNKSTGNEFVWVPVPVTEIDTATNIASFYRSEWSGNERITGLSADFTEPYAGGYTEEATEYADMYASVYAYHGFYIGRYEAGSITPRIFLSNGTTEMVVKKDVYPYIYVGWGATMNDYTSDASYNSNNQGKGAVYLSKQLYSSSTSVTSTLCYGIQWDATLEFIKDAEHNITSSTLWGNYQDSTYTTTETSKYSTDYGTTWTAGSYTKSAIGNVLLTTGANENFKSKNIYDIAGNTYEWTIEAYTINYRINRGGDYASNGSNYPSSDRHDNGPSICGTYCSFRPTLYIK